VASANVGPGAGRGQSLVIASGTRPREMVERVDERFLAKNIERRNTGVLPSDSLFEPYLAMAEVNVPLGTHMGPAVPGAPYLTPRYRARSGSPLLFEDALVRHPKLLVYVMHAGWPMLDDMIALLFTHPQVYVDVGVIDWTIPRPELHR